MGAGGQRRSIMARIFLNSRIHAMSQSQGGPRIISNPKIRFTGSRPSWPPVVMWDQMWDRELTRTHKPQKKFTKLP